MPTCVHCGKSAGLFRSFHAECRAQFERATNTIPLFFEKLLQSYLAPDKFERLLKEVAASFHIGPEELRALSLVGINAMIKAALAQHLMTPSEEDRILEVMGTVGFSAVDVDGLEDKLVKIAVLRDLDDGKIPDRVTVVGPMPFELKANESVVWIFNQVKFFRRPTDEPETPHSVSPVRRDMPNYFSPESLGNVSARKSDYVQTGNVDLMITNRQILVIARNRQVQIPLSNVVGFDTYSDGFQLTRTGAESKPLTFIFDDPWFAANLIIKLLRRSPNADMQQQETSPADAT